MSNARCGYVAIVGAPNAGKSTLLNAMVGQKIAIVTPKVQTTRQRITGICIADNTQIVFLDTPGIFEATQRFEQAMVASAWSSAAEADIILLVVDAAHATRKGVDAETQRVVQQLRNDKPVALVLNKVDAVKDKAALLALAQELAAARDFAQVFMISAREAEGIEDIKNYLAGRLPEGSFLYPEDEMTDVPLRQLAAEITREKLFLKLSQELPYSLAVETESWEERKDGSVAIRQVIYVQRESQKKIVLGKGGAMLKAIGMAARKELSEWLGKPAHLFLFVKVKEDWKEKPEWFQAHGLEFKS